MASAMSAGAQAFHTGFSLIAQGLSYSQHARHVVRFPSILRAPRGCTDPPVLCRRTPARWVRRSTRVCDFTVHQGIMSEAPARHASLCSSSLVRPRGVQGSVSGNDRRSRESPRTAYEPPDYRVSLRGAHVFLGHLPAKFGRLQSVGCFGAILVAWTNTRFCA